MATTQDHDVLRIWAAKNDASPAEIAPFVFDSEPTILTFLIGNSEGTAEIHPISWESFLVRFDLLELSLKYDNQSPRYELVRVEKRSTIYSTH